MKLIKLFLFLTIIILQFVSYVASSQIFTPGNLAVLTTGDGTTPLSSSSFPLAIVEYTTTGIATGVSVSLPSTGSTKITNSGVAVSDGMMSMSAERDRLIVAGYDAVPGVSNIVSTTAAAAPRVLFSVTSASGYSKVASSSTSYSGNNVRSGTASGANYFCSGASPPTPAGLEYLTLATSTVLTASPTNTRVLQIFNGQLYFSSASGTFLGVNTLGSGISTGSGQLSTLVSPVSNSAYGFSISPDGNTLYIADDGTGITKYKKIGASFVFAYLLTSTTARGLVVDYSGAFPILYATTTAVSSNTIIKMTDIGGLASLTTIATAPANKVFRGITFSPSCYASIDTFGSATICSGDSGMLVIRGNPTATITYNINGAGSYTTTIGNNGYDTLKTGALTTSSTYNLINITTAACAAVTLTGSATIKVNPLPATISGGMTVCTGTTITLSDFSVPGTWSSTNPAMAPIGSGTGIVSGMTAGTTDITYTLSTGCSTTETVTVNNTPPAITGVLPLCAGTHTTLSDATTGGTWSSDNTVVATADTGSGFVSGVTAGTANISYVLNTGCNATATITVNPLPMVVTGNTALCAGMSSSLSDTTTGGAWSSDNTAVATIGSGTGTVAGIAAGTTNISYILSTGCMTTASVTVNPLPLAITGIATLCAGTNNTLSDATAGGTWSSDNTGVATIGTSSGIVSGLTPGTATITYGLGSGCTSETIVTVNPLPLAITGETKFCEGANSILSDTTGGGTWSSNNTAVATISGSGTLAGINAGTAGITYTLGTGCTTATTITVNPLPLSVGGTVVLCAGTSTTLSDATAGGLWTSDNTATATIGSSSGLISGVSAGTAIISYVLNTGCATTAMTTIKISPRPITGIAIVCAGSSAVLSDATFGGTWGSDNTAVATIGPGIGTLSGVSAGTANVTYTLGTGCTQELTATVNPVPSTITGVARFCLGSSITLSDAVKGGTWSCNNTAVATVGSTTGAVSGTAAGTASITYSLATGCAVMVTITVDPLPSTISGTTTFCAGANTVLSDAIGPGAWSSPGYGGIVSVGSATGIVTGVSAGTAKITYTLSTGCATVTTVTVNSLPLAIIGTTVICAGTASLLSDVSTGGTWGSSNTAVATIGATSGVTSGITGGTANITYLLHTGCSVTTTVTVIAIPSAITGSKTLCTGKTTILSDATGSGIWSSGNTSVATVGTSTGTVSGVLAGSATITYSVGTGCFAVASLTVNALPLPITGSVRLCAGTATVLSDASVGGTWSSDNTVIATVDALSGLVNGMSGGAADITYSLSTGCIAKVTVNVLPLPTPITGNPNVCIGFTDALSDAGGGTWSSSDRSVATVGVSTGVITGISYGTVTITYMQVTGCFVTKSITVNPLPTAITGTGAECVGSSASLSDGTPGGAWNSGNTTVVAIGAGTGIITGISGGSTVVTYTLATGCITTKTIKINDLPSVISGAADVCAGFTTLLSDMTVGGTWNSDNTAVATIGARSGLVTGITTGTAMITYTLSTGCAVTKLITVDPMPSAIGGITLVCQGQVTSLSDPSGGGVWSSSNTGIATVDAGTGAVAGIAGGTTIITYVLATGCSQMVTVTVTPQISPITGIPVLCKGSAAKLADLSPGGIWSSSDHTIASVDGTGLVLGILPGTVVVSYQTANTCGKATVTVTVNSLPDAGAIKGATTICAGSSTLLTDTAIGGVWTSLDPGIATVDLRGLVAAISTGMDSIFYTNTNNCGTAKISVAIFVKQMPNRVHIVTHPDSVLCTNTMFQNFGTNIPEPAETHYIWSAENAVVYATSANRQNCLVSFIYPGSSVVKLSTELTSSGCSSADSLTFKIGAEMSPNPVVVYAIPEFVCKDNAADSYQWGYDSLLTLAGNILQGEINQNYYNERPDFQNKSYWVITNHKGCTQKSYYNPPAQVNSSCNRVGIFLFPNPADSKINIEVDGIDVTDRVDAKTFSMMGKEINNTTIINGSGSIELSGLPPAVYMVVIRKNGIKVWSGTFEKK